MIVGWFIAFVQWLFSLTPWLAAIGEWIVWLVALIVLIVISLAVLAFVAAMIDLVFDPRGKQRVGRLVANLVGGGLDVLTELFLVLGPDLETAVGSVVQAWHTHGATLEGKIGAETQSVVESVLQSIRGSLAAAGESTPANAEETAAEAFKVAFGTGLTSAAIAASFEALLPERLNTLNGVAPMLATLAGFGEVAGKVLEPLYKHAFGTSLDYAYKSRFKPDYPSEGDAVTWHSRGLLTDDQLKVIFGVSGLKSEYEAPYVESAYRPISAFILLRMFQAGVFNHDELIQLMTFAGVRPADQVLLEKYTAFAIPAPERAQALSAMLTAAERGTLTPAEVDAAIDSLQAPPQIKPYVQLTIAWRRLEQLAEIYRKSVTEAYKTGQISDAEYVPHLEAIGIETADAEAHYALDSIAVRGKALAAEERAAHAVQVQNMRAAIKLAIQTYRSEAPPQ